MAVYFFIQEEEKFNNLDKTAWKSSYVNLQAILVQNTLLKIKIHQFLESIWKSFKIFF